MSNPLEGGTYRLYVWEVGGSSEDPTDTGRTGTLEEMSDLGHDLVNKEGAVKLDDGRTLTREDLAGYVLKPEPKENA